MRPASRRAAVLLARLRAICLALPETTERPSDGEPTWFVGKRVFANFADHHHDDRVALWCAAPDGAQEALLAHDAERFFRPPYVGHRGWIGVYLDLAPPAKVDWREIEELVRASYREVAPHRLRVQLGEEGEAARGAPRRRR
jgi:hypothetical protein